MVQYSKCWVNRNLIQIDTQHCNVYDQRQTQDSEVIVRVSLPPSFSA